MDIFSQKESNAKTWIRKELPGSYFPELRNHFFGFLGVKILKFFDADPGWRQFGSGMEKSRIRDKHPGSTTLHQRIKNPRSASRNLSI